MEEMDMELQLALGSLSDSTNQANAKVKELMADENYLPHLEELKMLMLYNERALDALWAKLEKMGIDTPMTEYKSGGHKELGDPHE
jgi:hypothetical protein